MKKAYCLMNHILTPRQEAELRDRYGVETVLCPDKALSQKWEQIPVAKKLDAGIVEAVVSWLSGSGSGDILVVQGETGSTFMLADYALKRGLVPLYAVTKRVETEEVDGETVRRHYVFEHVCFRTYAYYGQATVV